MKLERFSNGDKPRRRSRLRTLAKVLLALVLLVVVVLVGGFLWFRAQLPGSLPVTDGERALPGLDAAVTVERDALGIPTITGETRDDVALATGFVHAQDRFFQMDLLRRRSAGELTGLLGGPGRTPDRYVRVHRLRDRARRAFGDLEPAQRRLLEAYARGVNAGIDALEDHPFEYLLLRTDPAPWKPEDSLLVMLAMSLQLEGGEGGHETLVSALHELYPPAMADFLTPTGDGWNAPLVGEPFEAPPLPSPEEFDLRAPGTARPRPEPPASDEEDETLDRADPPAAEAAGSNAWAVGTPAAARGALLANELHLGLTVPNLWYRTAMAWPGHRLDGVTLPGLPSLVVGSNGHVAWGFSSSMVDTSDVVLLELDPNDPDVYRTPDGPRRLEHHQELLDPDDDPEEALDVAWTVWGPVLEPDALGRPRALRWVVHEPGGLDYHISGLETARTVDEALDVANRSGAPSLNLVAADASGRVGWTILGRLPRRVGLDGARASSWSDGTRRWDGLVDPAEMPRVVDPGDGLIWTANNRVGSEEMLSVLGDDGYLPGARARLIRDRLRALEGATEEDMLDVQRDVRATFLERWRRLMLDDVLTPDALEDQPRRREMRELVENWSGEATVDATGYRMVRYFRVYLARQLFESLSRRYADAAEDPHFLYIQAMPVFEGTLWRLVTERPMHLLDPRHGSWKDQFLAAVDETIELSAPDGEPLREVTWGLRNTVRVPHPLSVVPGLGDWLDMPTVYLPGDNNMPRVQHPHMGSTLRMVVSPGHEDEGFFTMPGGQSGHPESPHYRDAHQDWADAAPAPFLPGPAVHRLRLTPASPVTTP